MCRCLAQVGLVFFFLASRSASFPSGARYIANESSSLQVYGISTTTIATYAGAPFSSTSLTNSTDVPFIFSLVVSSSSFNQWGNGVVNSSVGTTGSVSGTKLIIGASGTGYESIFVFAGQMGEIIVYNNALTTPQRQVIEGYLAHKWGITKYYNRSFPLSISGCQLWLDGADPIGTGLLPSNGATVSTWVDKSGNSNSLTAVGTPTYISASSSIYLNGSSYLQNTNFNSTAYTLFIVSRQISGNGPLYTNNTTSNGYTGFFPNYTGVSFLIQADNNWIITPGSPFANGTTYLYSIQYDSSNNINLWYNGNNTPTITGTAGTITRNQFILGKRDGDYMTGNIFEVIQYKTSLTTTQRQTIETYLARKWGITIAEPLPSSHPYLNFIPGSLREFVPTSLSGCQLWLDGADSSTVTGTTTVTQWRDKSGNTRHLGVGSGTTSYSSKAIQLANSYMFVTSPIDLTKVSVFIVAKTTGGNNQTVFSARPNAGFSWSSLDGFGFYMDSQSSIRFYGELSNSSSFNVNTSTPQLFSFQSSGTSISGRYNGTSQSGGTLTSSRTSTAKGFAIGGEWHRDQNEYINFVANASLYEIITYNSDITTSQLQAIEGYLALKWGLTGSLPSGHPYKSFSPYSSLTNTFLPTLVPGCQLWFDAADPLGTGRAPSSGTTITSWKDKSGNANNATGQVSAVVTSDSTGSYLNFTGSNSYTIGSGAFIANQYYTIFIVETLQSPSFQHLIGNGTLGPDNAALHIRYDSPTILRFASFNNDLDANNIPAFTTAAAQPTRVLTFSQLPSSRTIYINSTSFGSNTNNTLLSAWAQPLIGQSFGQGYYTGKMREIIFYTGQLTTTQRHQVESYLAWKWGLQVSLPSDHTYKFAPPSI